MSCDGLDAMFSAPETRTPDSRLVSSPSDLPSWCPDWRNLGRQPLMHVAWHRIRRYQDISRVKEYEAAGPSRTAHTVWPSADSRILVCQGTWLGNIGICSVPPEYLATPSKVDPGWFRLDLVKYSLGLRSGCLWPSTAHEAPVTYGNTRPRPPVKFDFDHRIPYHSTEAIQDSMSHEACFIPMESQPSDVVALLDNCSLPAVLRPICDRDNTYSIVGPLISARFLQVEEYRRFMLTAPMYEWTPPKATLPTQEFHLL